MPELQIHDIANGLLIVIIGVLSWLGINRGRRSKEEEAAKPQSALQVAGALIDGRQADKIVEAINKNTDIITIKIKISEDLHDAVRELRTDIRELTREIVRWGGRS